MANKIQILFIILLKQLEAAHPTTTVKVWQGSTIEDRRYKQILKRERNCTHKNHKRIQTQYDIV